MPLTIFYIICALCVIMLFFGAGILFEICRQNHTHFSKNFWILSIILIGTSIIGIGNLISHYDVVVIMQADYIMESGEKLYKECPEHMTNICKYHINQWKKDSVYLVREVQKIMEKK